MKRGAKPAEPDPLIARVRELEEKDPATARTILEIQGEVAGQLGWSLNGGKNC